MAVDQAIQEAQQQNQQGQLPTAEEMVRAMERIYAAQQVMQQQQVHQQQTQQHQQVLLEQQQLQHPVEPTHLNQEQVNNFFRTRTERSAMTAAAPAPKPEGGAVAAAVAAVPESTGPDGDGPAVLNPGMIAFLANQRRLYENAQVTHQRNALRECNQLRDRQLQEAVRNLTGEPADGVEGANSASSGTVNVPVELLNALAANGGVGNNERRLRHGRDAPFPPAPTRNNNKYYVPKKGMTDITPAVYAGWAAFEAKFAPGDSWQTMRGRMECFGGEEALERAVTYFHQIWGGKWNCTVTK